MYMLQTSWYDSHHYSTKNQGAGWFQNWEKYSISDHQSNDINELPIYLIDSCHK